MLAQSMSPKRVPGTVVLSVMSVLFGVTSLVIDTINRRRAAAELEEHLRGCGCTASRR